jgi:hypothetical protein
MATIVHDNFRNAQLGNPAAPTTTVDFDADDIRCSLIDQTDVTITAAMDSYDDVDADPVAEGAAMTNKTVGSTTGVFDSTVDYTFSSVAQGLDAADYLVLYKYNATPANATLIITWDTTTTGLPVTPNGGDITVQWNGSGILQI